MYSLPVAILIQLLQLIYYVTLKISIKKIQLAFQITTFIDA